METPSASRERADAVTVDRLSDLPDGVLADVQSRLTYRQAVRTGALSRRWRNLIWPDAPYPPSGIDIDQRAFGVAGIRYLKTTPSDVMASKLRDEVLKNNFR
ncbi:hypothetical protein BAE44_0017987 [Dichanthelium oligosanthes]|uniref:F-box domain-containing protein n=1 Tax=Dichanthelium oligosanthes TaxID=888268 RepID=A0A1E5V7I8_9POAL|nr:hypothetical protein BAE44_0017987 [Dichanthelium oligosanthes]